MLKNAENRDQHGRRPLDAAEQADDHGIDKVNEKATDQRHDQERLVGRTVLLSHGRHVDDGRRGGTEGNPAKSGSNHAGFVIAPIKRKTTKYV